MDTTVRLFPAFSIPVLKYTDNKNSLGDCIYSEDMVERVKLAWFSKSHSHTWSHPHLPTLTKEQGKVDCLFFFYLYQMANHPFFFFSQTEMEQIEGACFF